MSFVNVGFSHFVDATRIFNVCKPGSSPVRKQLMTSKNEGRHIDCTEGKKTRSIVFSMCNDKIIVISSTFTTFTMIRRIEKALDQKQVLSEIQESEDY